MTDLEENKDLALVLAVLATADADLKPDYHQVAKKIGIAHARTAQQKFKKLIESTKKYALVNGKVVDLNDNKDGDGDGSVPTTPAAKGRGRKATATPKSGATSGRKRKAAKKAASDDDEDGDSAAEEETPAKKKRATPARKTHAKKLTKEEDEDSDDNEADKVKKEGTEAGSEKNGSNVTANDGDAAETNGSDHDSDE